MSFARKLHELPPEIVVERRRPDSLERRNSFHLKSSSSGAGPTVLNGETCAGTTSTFERP